MRWLAIAMILAGCGSPPPAAEPVGFDDIDALEPVANRGLHSGKPELRSAEANRQVAPPPRRVRPVERRPIWRGRRIDLDVRNADLDNLFRFLAEVGGINIVIAPDVRGSVTLRLKSVPWDQIADVVARANGLEIERDGRLWLVRKRGGAN